jgi:hypothetical protein
MTESEYFKSEEFQESLRKRIEKETWDKGLPKVYMEDGKIIKHYKDGTKEIIENKFVNNKLIS